MLLSVLTSEFSGELFFDDLTKSIYATDASVYRKLPFGVAYPKTDNDIKLLIKYAKENNIPLQIFRLSGIYSDQKNIFKRINVGEARIVKKEKHFFSRVHIEDIANVLFHSLRKFKRNEIFNISDNYPSSQEEIAYYGFKLLKLDPPSPTKLDHLEDGMLKDFYKESKKVDNKKMKEFFNYKLTYPTFKEGLNNIFNNII